MIAQWYVEAGKYNVLPIDGSGAARLMVERPQMAAPRDRYVYRPGTQTVPAWVSPRLLNRPHSVTADVEIPAASAHGAGRADGADISGGSGEAGRPDGAGEVARAEGVLLCQGTSAGGWTMYLLGGVLHYAHNYLRRQVYRVSAVDLVPPGRHELRFEFEPTGPPDFLAGKGAPGRAQLYVDGRLAGQAEFPVTTPIGLNPGGLTCGANPGSAVVADYRSPFRFTRGRCTR